MLHRHKVRAVCLFKRNIVSFDQLKSLTRQLREVMGEDALIAIDQEGGSVVRTDFLPHPPAAMALGVIGDVALSRAVGAAVARGLRQVGINWNFAPVVDINSNPNNVVIGMRSFGANPEVVTTQARAWIEGSLGEGVACCIKHFPGHGDTRVDSHLGLPVVDKSRAVLEADELYPFRVLADQVPAVMTAHIVYPQIDPLLPATLSPLWLQGVLRGEMGYRGVVVSDALDMGAIAMRYGLPEAALKTLVAGTDMALTLGTVATVDKVVEALSRGLDAGVLSADMLAQKTARIDLLARTFLSSADPVSGVGDFAADEALMVEVARRGLRLVHPSLPPPAPPLPSRRLRLWLLAQSSGDGISEAGVSAQALLPWFSGFSVDSVVVEDFGTLAGGGLAGDGAYNILVSTGRSRYAPAAVAALTRLHQQVGFDLHLLLWNPFVYADLPCPALLVWGQSSPCLQAMRAWLRGEVDALRMVPQGILT